MKLVLIEWIDSHHGRGWRSLDQIEAECQPLFIRSVGWLVSEKNGQKIIVGNLYSEKNEDVQIQAGRDICIPNKAIIKTTVLRGK